LKSFEGLGTRLAVASRSCKITQRYITYNLMSRDSTDVPIAVCEKQWALHDEIQTEKYAGNGR